MLPADQTTVRRANLGVVLRHVAAGGSQSRARIAADTGLTRGTVSSLVDRADRPRAAAGDGRDDVAARHRTPRRRARARRRRRRDRARGQRRLRRGLRRGPDRHRPLRAPVVPRQPRLGAGARARPARARGPCRARGRRPRGPAARSASRSPSRASSRRRPARSCSRRTWAGSDLPVAAELEARLGLPVHVENESNLAALAEHWTGAAVGIDDFVCVFGEVGVGGGIVLGGRLFRGSHGFGGEFGHVSVDANGARARAAAAGASRRSSARSRSHAPQAVPPVTGRSRSLTDELVRRAEVGRAGGRPRAGRSRTLARHRARFDLQPPRRPGRRPRRLLRPARAVARGRRPPDAPGALAGRPLGVVRRRCRRRSATAPPCAARRPCRFTACSTRRGRCRPRAGASEAVAPRRRANGRRKEVAVARRVGWSDRGSLNSRDGPSSVPAGGI